VHVCGVRTLRHFAAHLELKRVPSQVNVNIGENLLSGTSTSQISRMWRLPAIDVADHSKLVSKPLGASDLDTWNGICANSSVGDVFAHCLVNLREILLRAETIL